MNAQFSQLHIAESKKNKEFQEKVRKDQERRLFDFKLKIVNLLYLANLDEQELKNRL